MFWHGHVANALTNFISFRSQPFFVCSWFIKSFVFLSLGEDYKAIKNKAALHYIHISPAQRSKHTDLT